ncbi:hypothetical protein CMV_027218, partial [Castanea mollissima]
TSVNLCKAGEKRVISSGPKSICPSPSEPQSGDFNFSIKTHGPGYGLATQRRRVKSCTVWKFGEYSQGENMWPLLIEALGAWINLG